MDEDKIYGYACSDCVMFVANDDDSGNSDDGDIDAMNCDMVVQHAVWGETVYG